MKPSRLRHVCNGITSSSGNEPLAVARDRAAIDFEVTLFAWIRATNQSRHPPFQERAGRTAVLKPKRFYEAHGHCFACMFSAVAPEVSLG